jgi:hypothetical protein
MFPPTLGMKMAMNIAANKRMNRTMNRKTNGGMKMKTPWKMVEIAHRLQKSIAHRRPEKSPWNAFSPSHPPHSTLSCHIPHEVFFPFFSPNARK